MEIIKFLFDQKASVELLVICWIVFEVRDIKSIVKNGIRTKVNKIDKRLSIVEDE